jgi:acyl-CoA thioesterase-1
MEKLILTLYFCLFFGSLTFSQSKTKIACIGDSITEGPGRESPASYPLQLGEILGDAYEVKNFGVSGRTLLKRGDFPFWNEPQFEEAKAYTADILLIKLGTNDTKPQNWKYKDDFKKDYIALINEMRKAMPEGGQIYLINPVPVFQDNFNINAQVMDEEIRPLLIKIAAETDVEILDLYSPLLPYSELFPDGIHPNTEGLSLMAEALSQKIIK